MNTPLARLQDWWKNLSRCQCDACTGRVRVVSQSPYVSHGLHISVGRDGKLHYRKKSSIRDVL